MSSQEARVKKVTEVMFARVLRCLEAAKPQNTISDYSFFIAGFLIIIGAIIWDYFSYQSLSNSISKLAPTPDVATANIARISALLGVQGLETTMIFGVFGIGFAFVGFGFAWWALRSSGRTTALILNATTVIGQTITEVMMEEFDRLGQQLKGKGRVKKK
jgi:hypothetical protein